MNDRTAQFGAEFDRRTVLAGCTGWLNGDGLNCNSSQPSVSRQTQLRQQWRDALGHPASHRPAPRMRVGDSDLIGNVVRTHVTYTVEVSVWTEAYLLHPRDIGAKVAGVVVFHSTVPHTIRQPAGLEGQDPLHLGVHLAKQGIAALCPRNYLWDDPTLSYAQAAERLLTRHPSWTGMGKMVSDGQAALDLLQSLPYVDAVRLGAAGHSLGAKEVLYLSALDPRIKVGMFSEGGLGIDQSNWGDPWYLGELAKAPWVRKHHQSLLALSCSAAMLVLGGGSADDGRTTRLVQLNGEEFLKRGVNDRLRHVDHGLGHTFPEVALNETIRWFRRWLT